MIAGTATARTAQDQRITLWSCGGRRTTVSSSTPTCGSTLTLHVNFPSCWDGQHLDSADHKSHMAYAVRGSCRASHPVGLPSISLIFRYPITGGSGVALASGGQYSAHGDFFNAWRQGTLTSLVNRCLNALRHCQQGS